MKATIKLKNGKIFTVYGINEDSIKKKLRKLAKLHDPENACGYASYKYTLYYGILGCLFGCLVSSSKRRPGYLHFVETRPEGEEPGNFWRW